MHDTIHELWKTNEEELRNGGKPSTPEQPILSSNTFPTDPDDVSATNDGHGLTSTNKKMKESSSFMENKGASLEKTANRTTVKPRLIVL